MLAVCSKKDLKSGFLQTSGLFVCVKKYIATDKIWRSTAVR